MKIHTIIGGVNGVGKSSFIGALKRHTTDLGMIVDVDKITMQLCKGDIEGGKAAFRVMEDCIEKGVSFTQEATLSEQWVLNIAQRAHHAGYYSRLYYIGLDNIEECKERIANRVARGGHNINTEDVESRFADRWEAVKSVLPYCDEASFYDNYNGFVEIAAYRNGELILEGEYRPQWIFELSEYLKTEA